MTNLLTAITLERLLIVALAVALGWSYVTGDAASDPMRPDLTYQSGLIEGPEDLEATNIFHIRVGGIPDSTVNDQITLPSWMKTLSGTTPSDGTSPDSLPTPDFRSTEDPAPPPMGLEVGTNQWTSTMRSRIRGLPYVVVPMKDGRPALSVTANVATLQSFSPRTGMPIEWNTNIPQQNNRLSPYATTQLLPGTAAVHSGLQYAHTWRDAWIFSSATAEWSAGYGLTEHGAGAVGSVTVTADVRW